MSDDIFLKVTSGVGDDVNNTYLTLGNATVYDASGISIEPISLVSAQQASEVVNDESPPELLEYSLFLNEAAFTLTFDEPITASSLEGESVIFTDSNNVSLQNTTLSLQPTTTANASENVLTIMLVQTDLDGIKSLVRSTVFLQLLDGCYY